jgi:RNA polymerase sigma-70 factor (ECF subfamily)
MARDGSARPVPPDFETLYGLFGAAIRRHLGRLVGPESAEDLSQEAFAKIAWALPSFEERAKLSTWVYRIATNVALDALRRRVSERATQDVLAGEQVTAPPPPGIHEELARREMNACIREHVERLPVVYRVALSLSEEGLTNHEIAETVGVTVGTVKIRLHRARRRLREQLGAGCRLYRDERNELACEPTIQLVPLTAGPGVGTPVKAPSAAE